jgi:hypothetical protein
MGDVAVVGETKRDVRHRSGLDGTGQLIFVNVVDWR